LKEFLLLHSDCGIILLIASSLRSFKAKAPSSLECDFAEILSFLWDLMPKTPSCTEFFRKTEVLPAGRRGDASS